MLGTNYKEKKCKGGLFRDKIVKTSPFKKFINKSPNKKDYDFIICIYNEDNNEIYYVKFDT